MIYAATPCGRPDNLLRIMKTIPDSWGWIIGYDDRVEIPDEVKQKATLVKCNNTGPAGIYARNHILDHYDFKDEDWIFQLDDDNIIHPDIEEAFKDITEYSDYAIIAFNQCFWNNEAPSQDYLPQFPDHLDQFPLTLQDHRNSGDLKFLHKMHEK